MDQELATLSKHIGTLPEDSTEAKKAKERIDEVSCHCVVVQ